MNEVFYIFSIFVQWRMFYFYYSLFCMIYELNKYNGWAIYELFPLSISTYMFQLRPPPIIINADIKSLPIFFDHEKGDFYNPFKESVTYE